MGEESVFAVDETRLGRSETRPVLRTVPVAVSRPASAGAERRKFVVNETVPYPTPAPATCTFECVRSSDSSSSASIRVSRRARIGSVGTARCPTLSVTVAVSGAPQTCDGVSVPASGHDVSMSADRT